MLIVIWRYIVPSAHEAAFRAAYNADGAWAKLFRQSPAYRGTELLEGDACFLTIDRWENEAAYDAFLGENRAAYASLDAQCDALTSEETLIGRFTPAS